MFIINILPLSTRRERERPIRASLCNVALVIALSQTNHSLVRQNALYLRTMIRIISSRQLLTCTRTLFLREIHVFTIKPFLINTGSRHCSLCRTIKTTYFGALDIKSGDSFSIKGHLGAAVGTISRLDCHLPHFRKY